MDFQVLLHLLVLVLYLQVMLDLLVLHQVGAFQHQLLLQVVVLLLLLLVEVLLLLLPKVVVLLVQLHLVVVLEVPPREVALAVVVVDSDPLVVIKELGSRHLEQVGLEDRQLIS